MLGPGEVDIIISSAREKFLISDNAEITLEMNPEDLCADKIRGYVNSGINRIVLGVQSLNDELRRAIGRRGKYDVREQLDLFFH